MVQGQLRQKSLQTLSQWKKAGYDGAHNFIPATAERLWSRLVGQKVRPYLILTRAKRAGSMYQEVEHLSHKCKALNSNTSTAKRKKRK
jgi:hypothetical protein